MILRFWRRAPKMKVSVEIPGKIQRGSLPESLRATLQKACEEAKTLQKRRETTTDTHQIEQKTTTETHKNTT